jgi:hypothetical protein
MPKTGKMCSFNIPTGPYLCTEQKCGCGQYYIIIDINIRTVTEMRFARKEGKTRRLTISNENISENSEINIMEEKLICT